MKQDLFNQKFLMLIAILLSLGTQTVIAADLDRDSLPDDWELANNRDPSVPDYITAAGWNTSCAKTDAVGSDGVICWGDTAAGQDLAPPLVNVRQLAIGANQVCAIDDSSSIQGVTCWGSGSSPNLTNVDDIAAFGFHMCAISEATVICWGDSSNNKTLPPTLNNPINIAVGTQHSCAIDQSGLNETSVVCWGSNVNGQITVPDLINPFKIAAGDKNTCALFNGGEVACWGEANSGVTSTPVITDAVDISVGRNMACVLRTTGQVSCWGSDSDGQSSPPSFIKAAAIDSGFLHNCALEINGVQCWGSNNVGQSNVNALYFDSDGDGVQNINDALPLDKTETTDSDQDGVGDNSDNCPNTANPDQLNSDNDPEGDACDLDDDNDGTPDIHDDLPRDPTENTDTDRDGIGNNADTDDDNDRWLDVDENTCGTDPLDRLSTPLDTDRDNICNVVDTDDDNDGTPDENDAFSLDFCADTDTDNDGMPDTLLDCHIVSDFETINADIRQWPWSSSNYSVVSPGYLSNSSARGRKKSSSHLSLTYTFRTQRQLSFYYKNTGNSDGSFDNDYNAVTINGRRAISTLPPRWDNKSIWQKRTITVPRGTHTITWHNVIPVQSRLATLHTQIWLDDIHLEPPLTSLIQDHDDDNDNVIDTVDAAPLDNSNKNEIDLPLGGGYRGGKTSSSQ